MDVLGVITAVSSLATTVGIFLTGWQVRLAKQQARTQFEDALAHEYRDIVFSLPINALLGKKLSEEELKIALGAFYRYIDLTNEQVSLRQQGRIRGTTWENWQSGIQSNMSKPAFKDAWFMINSQPNVSFEEFRWLESQGFKSDPIKRRSTELKSKMRLSYDGIVVPKSKLMEQEDLKDTEPEIVAGRKNLPS